MPCASPGAVAPGGVYPVAARATAGPMPRLRSSGRLPPGHASHHADGSPARGARPLVSCPGQPGVRPRGACRSETPGQALEPLERFSVCLGEVPMVHRSISGVALLASLTTIAPTRLARAADPAPTRARTASRPSPGEASLDLTYRAAAERLIGAAMASDHAYLRLSQLCDG